MAHTDIASLKKRLVNIRKDIIRMTTAAGSGHPTTSFSAAEIVTALFFNFLRHDPKSPEWPDRDRFILSKGHGAPLLYAVMAQRGYFSPDQLMTLRQLGSPLQGHPERQRLAGVEASTGSLGQGLSIGIGMALAGRIDHKDYRVYVLTGDGELNEGQVWEAALLAGHQKLGNLTAIIDRNGQQQDGWCQDVLDTEPLHDKWRAFGWHPIEINGHDLEQIHKAFEEARGIQNQPSVIIARTVKGKGVSFMENNDKLHGVPLTLEEAERAMVELEQGVSG